MLTNASWGYPAESMYAPRKANRFVTPTQVGFIVDGENDNGGLTSRVLDNMRFSYQWNCSTNSTNKYKTKIAMERHSGTANWAWADGHVATGNFFHMESINTEMIGLFNNKPGSNASSKYYH